MRLETWILEPVKLVLAKENTSYEHAGTPWVLFLGDYYEKSD